MDSQLPSLKVANIPSLPKRDGFEVDAVSFVDFILGRLIAGAPAMLDHSGTFNGLGFAGDLEFHAATADPNVQAVYQFTGLTAGLYKVQATWNANANRATNSQYIVTDGALHVESGESNDRAVLSTFTVNQRVVPEADDVINSNNFEDLGSVIIGGSTLTVAFRPGTTGFGIADAVRIVQLPPPITLTVSTNPASFSESAGAAASTGTVSRTGSTSGPLTVNLASNDTSEATVPATVVIPDGQSSVNFNIDAVDDNSVDGAQTVTITASGNANNIAPGSTTVDVTDDDVGLTVTFAANSVDENATVQGTVTRNGDTSSAVTINLVSNDTGEATVPSTVSIPANQVSANFTVSGVTDNTVDGDQVVTITASGSGLVDGAADITVNDVDVPPISIIDNGDAGFAIFGSWGTAQGQGFQNDVHFHGPALNGDRATWTFNNLTPGNYRVSTTWTPQGNRASNSPFSVFDGNTLEGVFNVNQQQPPNDFSDSGATWEDLGSGIFAIAGNSLTVELGLGNNFVIADAIRIELLNNSIESRTEAVAVDINVSAQDADVNAANDGADDEFRLRLNDDGDLEVLVNGAVVRSNDPEFVNNIVISGSHDNDLIVLDYSNGQLPNVVIDGSGDGTDNDSLQLIGTVDSVAHQLGDAATITIGDSEVSLTDLESINDRLIASQRSFESGDDPDALIVSASESGEMSVSDVISERTVNFTAPTDALTIDTNAGADTVDFQSISASFDGTLSIITGAGQDTVVFGSLRADSPFAVQVLGGAGDDSIDARRSMQIVTINGGDGDDKILGGRKDDQIDGGAGNDLIDGRLGDDVINGGAGNDNITGGRGNDVLNGNAGDDRIRGSQGNDQLNGDAGIDILNGGSGDDIIHGGDDHDVARGGAGNDQIDGGDGNDILSAGRGDDSVRGRGGNDVISGGRGNDLLVGDLGADVLRGQAGNDSIHGGAGDDIIQGGLGNDFAVGGLGQDIVTGNGGVDVLAGGNGDGPDDGDIVDAEDGERDEMFEFFDDWIGEVG